MKLELRRVWVMAMVGYAGVVVLLASGMIMSARRFDLTAAKHVRRIRGEEDMITAAERLRWSAEQIVSTGRGFLISSDTAFLDRLTDAQVRFDEGIRVLTRGATDARTPRFVKTVAADAMEFRRRQDALVGSLPITDIRFVANRFEAELVPLQQKLSQSLADLIDYKETSIHSVYEQVRGERARLRQWLNVLLSGLVVASLTIAGYIVTLLGRSLRKEQAALDSARRALAARDEILGVVAHDLRNPLSSIAMRAELMRETASSGPIRKHADSIYSVTQSMEHLIRSMLDVTTIESGHFTVNPAPCDVDDLLNETAERFDGIVAQKHVTLDRSSLPDAKVRADRERVLQVLGNLVGNAVKFTPGGGRVEVAAARTSSHVCFSVSDTGPGISPEHLPHVFDRFWKHETGGKKGTGLGLFIAKGIVEAHGGQIWVESAPDHGATFRFTLPC